MVNLLLTIFAGLITWPSLVFAGFDQDCQDSNVLFCQGFDALPPEQALLTGEGISHNGGACSSLSAPNVCPSLDNGALMFTIPSQSGAGASGSYYANFADISGDSIQPGETVFLRWKQKFSADFLSTIIPNGNGWKQVIIGDPNDWSCSNNELVVQNTYQRGFPQMYHACGLFDPFQSSLPGSDFDLQPGGDTSCLYSLSRSGSRARPNCFAYVADEWMQFQIGIDYSTDGNDRIQLWAAREGDTAWTHLIDYTRDLVDVPDGYGKVWFLPYHTNKDANFTHPEGYTWYDNLIVSTQFLSIEDDNAAPPPPPPPSAELEVVTVKARDGTEATFTGLGLVVDGPKPANPSSVEPPPKNQAPVAVMVTPGVTDLTVSLDGSGSSDPDGDALSYVWDFGDGNTGTGLIITHAYATAGTYTVTLSVNDGALTGTATAEVTAANPPSGGDLSALAAYVPASGEWSQVPNTDFVSHPNTLTKAETDAIDTGIWQNGISCVIDCWNGAAWDAQNHHLFLHGGGHNGYAGNEVYMLDLEDLTLTRLNDPSTLTGATIGLNKETTTGPASAHTYDGMVWSTETGTVLMLANSGDGDAGEFNTSTNTWSVFTSPTGWYPMTAEKADGHIYVLGGNTSGTLKLFDPATKQATTIGGTQNWDNVGSLVLWQGALYKPDTNANLNGGVPHIRTYNTSTGVGSVHTNMPAGVPGQSGLAVRGNQFVIWGGEKKVWVYDNDTAQWTTYSPTNGPASANPGRVYSRWVYLPELDVFAGYTHPGGLWLFKP